MPHKEAGIIRRVASTVSYGGILIWALFLYFRARPIQNPDVFRTRPGSMAANSEKYANGIMLI